MSLATNYLQLVRDHVTDQLEQVGPSAGEYTFDIAANGVEHRLRTVEQIRADNAPWVAVFSRRAVQRVGMGGSKSGDVEAVIFGVVVPDNDRWPGYTAAELAYLLFTDISKALESSARLPDERVWINWAVPIEVLIEVDPEDDRWGYVEITVSYETRGTLGA